MKHLVIILFLIFTSCKNKPKTKIDTQTETHIETESETESENVIDKSVSEIWNNYIESNPEFKEEEIPESWYFHNNREDANRLAELTLNGKKKAASGLYFWYKEAKADLPKIGTKHIITDFDGRAKAIIEIKKVDTIPFNLISEVYAEMDMGTKIEPLKKWKKAHWAFFASTMEESGEKPNEEMLIVREWFETIWIE
ncbi:ASCH domain-containing protein [Eudoraea sp.]|uniref:ASCH domain-containing protein n=1 Tax=Eudoraea sp. TaxID=1979955 RepID=UPI003C72F4EF